MVKHDEILSALRVRKTWEDRLTTWYTMRHQGLRRKWKPWKNAADMHYPLVDMQIDKQKPFYIQQLFATDTVATFAALAQEVAAYQSAAGQWFDYKLKQESNFEEEITSAIDTMLQDAKAIVKTYWDQDRKEVLFDAIHPRFVIVPPWTKRLRDADWIVHVQHFSKAAYTRQKNFKQDAAFIKSICGKGADEQSTTQDQEKLRREGLTYGTTEEEIVIWEVYDRTENGSWEVRTYSPLRPDVDVRPKFGLPYNKGIFARGVPPFAEMNAEVKDKGYYAPRGLAEKLAPFEASLCRDWNAQKDLQTRATADVYSAPNGLGGQQNVRLQPGDIVPFELKPVPFPQIPFDLQAQMNQTRQVAEEVSGSPLFGTQQMQGANKPRTAAEVNLAGSVSGQGTDSRVRTFRREMGLLLRMAWALYVQYAGESLSFFWLEELQNLPKEALSEKFLIEPSGSGDNTNRQLVLQRASARKQMFQGNPNIDQYELDKSVLEADDPRLVKRLLKNAGTQQAEQIEDQAQEISIMLLGFPAEVRPNDDDPAHLQSLFGFVDRRNKLREPLTPEQMRQISQHGAMHLQALKKKNPQAYQQARQQFEPFVNELAKLAQMVEQAQQARMQPQQGMPPAPGQQLGDVVPMENSL